MTTSLTPAQRDHLWQALHAAWKDSKDGAHDIAHIERVRSTALALMADTPEPVDGCVLEAAAILHDLIPIEKNDARRSLASRLAAVAALPYLRDIGFTPAQCDAAAHAIHAHSWSANVTPETIEAKLLQDADRLDALGAIGLARCLLVAGRLNQSIYHPTDPNALHRPLDDTRYCYDHFHEKLYHLPKTLHTPAAKRLGATRVAFMQSFWATLLQDAGFSPKDLTGTPVS